MINVQLPYLEPYQKDVLNYYIQNPKGKWIVTKSPRQVGKSILLSILLVYASLVDSYATSISISPTFKQAKKLFCDIQMFAAPLLKKANASSLEIEFKNGSIIIFGSAEQGDNLRGFTVKRSGVLCVDEAAFIKEGWFYDVCVPMTNVFHSDIFLFSTPKWQQGLFFNLYTKGISEDSGNIKSFDWTEYDLSKFLTEEILELYRQQLPKLSFQCEYLAQFINGEGTVFPEFTKCIEHYTLDKDLPLYITIDWGTGSGGDDTCLTFGQVNNGKARVSKQVYFNDKTPKQAIEYIRYTIATYGSAMKFKEINIIVEKNSIGAIYHSMLVDVLDGLEQRLDNGCEINVSVFTTTNQSKKKAVEKLELLFERELITIPNDKKLSTQLSMFEAKVNKDTGNIMYAGAQGSHDDCVMSLLFFVDRIYNEVSENI